MLFMFSNVPKTQSNSNENPNVLDHSGAHFAKMVQKVQEFLRVYKVFATGFPRVAKRCFPNGFLGLLGDPLGACALPRGPPVRVLSSESLIPRGEDIR